MAEPYYSGNVLDIFTAERMGAEMVSRESVEALGGVGLSGDRYALGTGAFSCSGTGIPRDITLISREAVERANARLDIPYTEALLRRNIVVGGIELNACVDRVIHIGRSVVLRGFELCTPCERPGKLARMPSLREAFWDAGGLRAQICQCGPINVGDTVSVTPDDLDEVLIELFEDRRDLKHDAAVRGYVEHTSSQNLAMAHAPIAQLAYTYRTPVVTPSA